MRSPTSSSCFLFVPVLVAVSLVSLSPAVQAQSADQQPSVTEETEAPDAPPVVDNDTASNAVAPETASTEEPLDPLGVGAMVGLAAGVGAAAVPVGLMRRAVVPGLVSIPFIVPVIVATPIFAAIVCNYLVTGSLASTLAVGGSALLGFGAGAIAAGGAATAFVLADLLPKSRSNPLGDVVFRILLVGVSVVVGGVAFSVPTAAAAAALFSPRTKVTPARLGAE